jgi:hypothetical protein
MFEKYEERLNKILEAKPQRAARRSKVRSTKRRSKRRSTKRRSTKRRSTKRRSTKRRSRFGEDDKEDEEDDKEVPVYDRTRLANTRNSLERQKINNSNERVDAAEAEVAEAKKKLAEAKEKLAEAEEKLAEAEEALPLPLQPPIAPKAAVKPDSKWGTPGERGPAPPTTAGYADKGQKDVPVNKRSAARAEESAKWVDEAVAKLVNEINKIGYIDKQGLKAVKFIDLFNHYVNISDSLVGIMIRAKKRGLIKYEGEMLQQGRSDNVVITVI